MTQPGSVDPFSTFLNVNRETSAGPAPTPDDRGTTRADVLRALLARQPGPVPLRDLSRELGARTTQVAVLVAGLDEEHLVTIGAAADDDLVQLTDAGVAAAGAVTDGES
jgi:DNA-binding MarR family transcriptional regulator